jgi:hypothetical protein
MNKWKQIRLELARTTDFPSGSVSRSYLLRLPIDDQDHVDRTAYRANPRWAVVRRHWSSEPDQSGELVEAGEEWIIRCKGKAETRLEIDGKPLRLGQQIGLKTDDGTVLPLRIASIR